MTSNASEPDWLRNWKGAPPVEPKPGERRADGTVMPGTVLNPKGKAPGTKALRTRLAEQFEEGVDAIVAVVKQKALEGDLQAAGLVLARAVPPKRSVSERTPFALDVRRPLADQAAQVAQAVADGHIAADDALTVLTCLDRVASLRQADTLEDRLQRLERGAAARDAQSGIVYEDPQS